MVKMKTISTSENVLAVGLELEGRKKNHTERNYALMVFVSFGHRMRYTKIMRCKRKIECFEHY